MAEDGGPQLRGPAQPLQFPYANEGMLVGRGVALIVVVVQQGRGGVELEHGRALESAQAQPVRFRLAIREDTGLHRQGMLAQALACGPLGQQLPGLFARVSGITACAHGFSFASELSAFGMPRVAYLGSRDTGFCRI